MGKSYYYFAASLPLVFFESTNSPSLEDYLIDCKRLLTEEDYVELKTVVSGDCVGCVKNKIAAKIQQAEMDCCNEKAYMRATRSKQNPMDHCRGERSCNPQLIDVMHRAAKEEDLLAGEKIIDRHRFEVLDDLSMTHFYDLEFLIIYGLKLAILDRYKAVSSAQGDETFEIIKGMELPEVVVV